MRVARTSWIWLLLASLATVLVVIATWDFIALIVPRSATAWKNYPGWVSSGVFLPTLSVTWAAQKSIRAGRASSDDYFDVGSYNESILGNPTRALACYAEGIKIKPTNALNYYAIVRILSARKRQREALLLLLDAPDDEVGEYWGLVAKLQEEIQDTTAAAESYGRAVRAELQRRARGSLDPQAEARRTNLISLWQERMSALKGD